MNVANLQLEGLVMALASLNHLLVRKGLVSIDEIERALHRTEADLTSEERAYEDMSPSNRDALCFPVRLLRLANQAQSEDGVPPFSELARMVGETKQPYNDQM
jgi:hypothetical protein